MKIEDTLGLRISVSSENDSLQSIYMLRQHDDDELPVLVGQIVFNNREELAIGVQAITNFVAIFCEKFEV